MADSDVHRRSGSGNGCCSDSDSDRAHDNDSYNDNDNYNDDYNDTKPLLSPANTAADTGATPHASPQPTSSRHKSADTSHKSTQGQSAYSDTITQGPSLYNDTKTQGPSPHNDTITQGPSLYSERRQQRRSKWKLCLGPHTLRACVLGFLLLGAMAVKKYITQTQQQQDKQRMEREHWDTAMGYAAGQLHTGLGQGQLQGAYAQGGESTSLGAAAAAGSLRGFRGPFRGPFPSDSGRHNSRSTSDISIWVKLLGVAVASGVLWYALVGALRRFKEGSVGHREEEGMQGVELEERNPLTAK